MNSKGKIFPGWLIVISGFLMMATGYAVFISCMSLFLVPVTADIGISRAQFTTNFSIAGMVGIFAALIVGRLVDRYSAKILGMAGVIAAVLTMLGWSQVTAAWQIYLLSCVEGLFVFSSMPLLVSILVSEWFDQWRGIAISIALSGSGVGGVIMSLLSSYLITVCGWRTTFLILAAITFVCAFPLTFALYNKPSDLGLLPYGAQKTAPADESQKTVSDLSGVGSKAAVRSMSFWMLILGFCLMGLISGGIVMNNAANFMDVGYTMAVVSKILSLCLFILIVGKLMLGFVYDECGLVVGTLLGGISIVVGTLSLAFSYIPIAPYCYAIFWGIGASLGTVAPPILVTREFGKRDLGSLTGYVTAGVMLGGSVGSIFMGKFYDITGSYMSGWLLLTALGILMLLSLLLSVKFAQRFQS